MRLALAGDTMLGRGVAERLRDEVPAALFAAEVVEAARAADLFIVNLECCISERGAAAEVLAHLGVDCVTLANNHALDFGPEALLDTLAHLRAAGVRWVGAGRDEDEARTPAWLEGDGERLRVVAFSDHPAEYAAGPDRPGVALADLGREELPDWLSTLVQDGEPPREGAQDPVLVCPHWGPNMVTAPTGAVRRAARLLDELGVGLVAGHSAHVFHGVA